MRKEETVFGALGIGTKYVTFQGVLLSVGADKASEFINEFQCLLARLVETNYQCREGLACRGCCGVGIYIVYGVVYGVVFQLHYRQTCGVYDTEAYVVFAETAHIQRAVAVNHAKVVVERVAVHLDFLFQHGAVFRFRGGDEGGCVFAVHLLVARQEKYLYVFDGVLGETFVKERESGVTEYVFERLFVLAFEYAHFARKQQGPEVGNPLHAFVFHQRAAE